jgi:non-specific serine/threonine protein kinase/serine/threonine-protein kinase
MVAMTPPGDSGEERTGPPSPREHPADGSRTWDRVHDLLHEAIDLEPAARRDFLSGIAEVDRLLAAEIQSLLSAYEASSDFLAEPPVAAFIPSVIAGDRLGPYRIAEEIGRGGMGVVYRATRDDESFTRDVAIKLIDPAMRSDQILRRFRAERQILAMLDHPHIARLIDGGAAPDGSPYLVMDYVSGRPILRYCDEEQLNVGQRLELFLLVCDAVQFAHQRLVVHRDLKSDNILVTGEGTPRLLDFGIAKLLSPKTGEPAATVTAPMHRMLTPDYASPEHIRGEPATVAGDVYSLGVVLYELLSGSRPFRFATRSPEEVLRVITEVEPASPSAAAARSPAGEAARRRGDTTSRLRRRLAGDLDHVVLKALEKDPARRYGSVDQFAQDIRRHLAGRPVLARGRSTSYRMSRFIRRHRAALVGTTLVALALVAGLAGTTWQAGVARRERDRAQRRFDDVRQLAHAVVFDIHDAIASLPGSTRARETLVQHALRYLDGLSIEAKGDLSLQRELALAYSKVGDVQGRPMFPNLGQSAAALGSYDKSLALLAVVCAAQPESAMAVHDLVVVSQRRSDLLNVMGRPREAMSAALETRERILAELVRRPEDPLFQGDLCVAYGRLVNMKQAASDTLGAIEECTAYLQLVERLFRASPADPALRRGALIACTKMAELLEMRGDRPAALAHYQRAGGLAREAVAALPHNTDASRDLSIVYGVHGMFLASGGEIDSALAVYGLSMTIAEQLAAQDPDNALQQADVAAGHHEIGIMLAKGRRYRAAEASFREAFERFGRLVAADTGNAEHRTYLARSGRGAAEACRALSQQVRSSAERSQWRARAAAWFGRSLSLYRELDRAGALTGEDAAAPGELERIVAGLGTGTGT